MPITIGQRPGHGFDEPLGLLGDCHRRIEHFLAVLTTLAWREPGQSLTVAESAELQAAVTYFATAAPKHTADEEHSLFPRLRRSANPAAAHALEMVTRLEHQHDEAEQHHALVDTLVRRWLLHGRLEPEDVRGLRDRLAALQAIYLEHIGLEDREVFPTAAKVLSSSQLTEIGHEMAARRSLLDRTIGVDPLDDSRRP